MSILSLSDRKQRVRQDMVRTIRRCRHLYVLSVVLVWAGLALGPIGMMAQRYYGQALVWPWVVYWVALIAAGMLRMLRRHMLRTLAYHQEQHIELAGEEEATQGDGHVE